MMERKNAWNTYTAEQLGMLEDVAARYRGFLDAGKTERECVNWMIAEAKKQGFVDLQQKIKTGSELQPGEKIYVNCMGKAMMLFLIGAAVFAVVTVLYTSMCHRMKSGLAVKTAPAVNALLLFLAAQFFQGIL